MANYPSMSSLVRLGLAELLEGLALRQDAREAALSVRAAFATKFLADHPKASLGQAELEGESVAGMIPEMPESLVNAMIESARSYKRMPKYGN